MSEITEVDKHALDEEWEKQAALYEKYALLLAEAKEVLNKRKAKLDLITAEVGHNARKNPARFGLDKITDATIKDAVLRSKQHQKGMRLRIKAQHRVDVLEATVSALEHKKKALENLVYLHGQSYFAAPKFKGDKDAIRKAKRHKLRSKIEPIEMRDK